MKRIGLKVVAVFEIIYGVFGLISVAGGVAGVRPYRVVPLLWYGIFPLVSLIAGVLLWLRRKHAFALSTLVLLLQVPFIYTGGFLLNLGGPLNLSVTGAQLSPTWPGAALLDINLLALGTLIVLWWCRPAARVAPGAERRTEK